MKIVRTQVKSGDRNLDGRFFEPRAGLPGILFVHGWAGSQARDAQRSEDLAQLGCICLTFDLSGHGRTRKAMSSVTPAQNLDDLCAAYDVLAAHPKVDSSCIAVVGSSYGAYLASILTTKRKIRWLSLRVPALYRDEDWESPKLSFEREMLNQLRSRFSPREANRAISACAAFQGDALIVESQCDELVAHEAVATFLASFICARSVTYRVIAGADHALSEVCHRRAYGNLLRDWVAEMVFGAR